MDVDAVIRRAPELALIDELAHTNAPGMRNEKRYQDIEEVLDAGIDVISTVNVQHLESLNDAIFELTGVRVRETFPDRILDEADEVVLVDLTPEALQERLRAGKVYPPERAEVALQNFFRVDKLSRAARARAARGGRGRRGAAAGRRARPAQPAGDRASGCSRSSSRSRSRSGSCAAPGARRSGSAPSIDALWVRRPGAGARPTRSRSRSPRCAASRSSSASHFLEEEGDDLVATVRRVADERGSTYVFVGTPDERRRREILARLAALARWSASCPGVDIRVVANRADRAEASSDASSTPRRARRRARGALVVAQPPPRRLRGARGPPHPRAVHRRQLDPAVLDAAIRIARAEDAVLVPAYLLIVPLEYARGLAAAGAGRVAMPLLEAVEHAALRAGVAGRRAHREGHGRRRTRCGGCGRSSGSTASSRRRVHGGHAGSRRRSSPGCSRTHRPRRSCCARARTGEEPPSPRRRRAPSRKRCRALAGAAR